MALLAVAETAEDIGSSLNSFLNPVADHSADITALIGQCFSTSSALRRLDNTIGDFPKHRRYHYIAEDLITVRSSLQYTFDDVQRLFGRLDLTLGAAYRRVWRDLVDFFYDQSGNTLGRRLELYQRFLHELTNTLNEGFPRDPEEFDKIKILIERLEDVQHQRLEDVQEQRLAEDLGRVSLGVSNIPKEPSFERNRPRRQAPAQPQSPPPLSPRPRRRRPVGPQSPPMDFEFDRRRDRFPPFAPEIPTSPSTTTTNTSSSSQSSNTRSFSSHWLPLVFEQSQPTTSLIPTGQPSVSYGADLGQEAGRRLADEYVKILEMPFENGDLLVRLYSRPDDFRSRILVRTIRPARSRKNCCLPLTHLQVERMGPFLKFVKVGNRPFELWACLKFSSYEKMVLFFCSFLALRSEDTKCEIYDITDSELHNEDELFGGRIVDDHYQHALRLYRDRDSGGIRLQASVLRGSLKRTPVWTAFITHQVQSRKWMKRAGSKVVHLADLQRYVFTTDYTPQVAPGGKHELSFINSSDAEEFMYAIDELVDR